MGLIEGFAELGGRDVGVNLGRVERAVAQQRLDRPQIGPPVQHVRRKAVAQEMRMNIAQNRVRESQADDPLH